MLESSIRYMADHGFKGSFKNEHENTPPNLRIRAATEKKMMRKNIFRLKSVVWIIFVITFAVFLSTAAICVAADGILQVTIEKSPQSPMVGTPVYLFTENGSYLGEHQTTDSQGKVAFNLTEGAYKIRVDYLGCQFWSPVYTINGDLSDTLTISHQDVNLTIQGNYPSAAPISNIPVYLFNEAGSYLSQHQTTDTNGQVMFNLPEQSYKVRADYMGQQFWSNPFTWQDTTVTIPMADAEITVTCAGAPVQDVTVYVFTASGSYLSINNATDANGKVAFHLAAGEYKFRADYQGSQYWSDPATLTAGQVNPVGISTGGGNFNFTVLKGTGVPLTDASCYVFSESGSYLNISDATDASGQVSFNLAEGAYKIRVDYLGYQFWSPVYTINGNLTETFTISHQEVTLTVQGNYPSMAPIPGVPIYLFTAGGAYVSQSQTADSDGHVTFNLPQQSYKVRADFLGQHFWSEPFTWQNTAVTISQGMAAVHVVRSGSDVANAKVYLFSESGAYLGINQTTDASGKAEFLLSNTAFKFRVDEGGNQYWSPIINIQPGVVNNVDIDISPVTVNISADPENIQAGQSSTLTWNSTGANTCVIEPGIGTVDVNGSMQVSPDATTTYTITATGPSGTATASTTVTVNAAPPFSETKLSAGDPSDFAYFGNSVSIYGDTAIVGAPYALNEGFESGAAYIYKYNGSSWVEQAKLVAGDGEEGDEFGWSVSIYGDTAIVGADCAYSQGYPTGVVYVFHREGSTWTQQAKLTPSDINEWAYFGSSVSIYDDYAIVGAEGGSNVEIPSGTAYIFKREGTTWTEQAKLAPSNGISGGLFGHSVSIYENYAIVGDGMNPNATGDANCAAYIFKTDGSSWMEQAKLFVQGFSDDGSSVSIYKDYAIVGTLWSIKNGIYQGAAFVFKRDGSVWNQQAQLTASDPAEDNYFGSSVAIYENYAIVGAYGNQENGSYVGAAYNFKQENAAWSEQTKLTASDSDQWPVCNAPWRDCSGFGRAVAIHGGNAIIGAYGASANGVMLGEAYIYSIHNVTVELNADPTTIQPGESTTLSWNSNNASSCVIEPGIGEVDTTGTIQVSPESTTTYTITATGPGGTATDSVTVNFVMPPPIINTSLSPETIKFGESSTLTWSTLYAESVIQWDSISGESQAIDLPLSGITTVSPTQTATYFLKATGPAGTTTYSVTVTVLEPPVINISADPEIIHIGESTTLTWNATNADTCNIEPNIGNVDTSGSITVSPTAPTSYTITSMGPGGTTTVTVEVTVILQTNSDNGIHFNNQSGGGGVVGGQICIFNGNSVESRLDLQFSSPNSLGFLFRATYNSQSDIYSSLGFGWSHTYSAVLDPTYAMAGQTYLKIVDQTGRAVYFKEETTGVYNGEFNERSQVKAEAGGYVWYRLDGSTYGFSSAGQLQWINDTKGNRLALAYDAQNRLQTVTDISSGRMLTFNYNAGGLLESISGPVTQGVPSGIWLTYGYDANQNLTSVTYADGSGFDYTYSDPNDVHNLTEKRDKAGHLLNTWGFDTQDRAISNFSVKGKGVNIQYVSETQVDVTDAYGTTRSYTIAGVKGRKRVTAMTGPGGTPYIDSNVVRWVYDNQMNLIEAETINGTIYQYQNYDVRGNPGTVKLASGTSEERVITYTYHPDMNVPLTQTEASVLGGGSKVTIFDYDSDGNAIPNENPTRLLYRVIEKGFTKDASRTIVPYEYVTAFTYNGKGQILTIDGPLSGNGDTTSFNYDGATGGLLSVTRPLIGTADFSNYDAAGLVGQVTDVNGQASSFTYDGRGRIVVITHQDDTSASSVNYNIAGLPDFRTDEDGVISSFEYDAVYGRLSKRIDAEGNYITYNYDAQGNMIEKSYYDPTDHRTKWKRSVYQGPTHTMPGKLFKTINPDDTFTQYDYDSEGNIASVTDANGNITYYDYDALNRLISVTQPGNVVTSYGYGIHGNLTSVTDAESHETTYEYDDMGRVLTTTSPDTGTVFYAYDEAGNLIQKTDAKGITTVYTYDLLNRLTYVGFPDFSQDIGYSYDAGTYGMGHRSGMTDPSGATTFGYDSRGRLVQKDCTLNGHTYSIARTFTSGSRVISTTYPSGRTVDYTRNSIGKISGVSTTGNGTTTVLISNLLYLPFGPSSGMDMGQGSGVNNVFDELYRTTATNPGFETERTYTYDANSNLTSINATNDISKNKTFTYDALNRLVHAQGAFGTIDYTYDTVGNRLTKVNNNRTKTYTYISGTNRLQETTGPVAYTYDTNGNTTGIGDKVLIYDQNNRLVRVEENSTILGEYVYNGLGQRGIKTADGVTTVYIYDFDGNLIAESQSDGTIISEYLYMGASRIARVDVSSGEIYYFHNDHLGTPELMTDANGNEVWGAIIKPFAEAIVKSMATVNNNFRLPGQIFDEETGLNYNYFRYYHPEIGRYVEADEIGLKGGMNLYVYSTNNPINKVDPLGLWTFTYSGGGHLPTGPWPVAAGGTASSELVNPLDASGKLEGRGVTPEAVVGDWADIGVSAGIGDLSGTGDQKGPIIALGFGRYAGVQFTLRKEFGPNKKWYNPLKYIDGVSFGIGLGLSLPVSIATPIDKPFGKEPVVNDSIGPRDNETTTPTIPEEYTPLPVPPLQYNPSNLDTMEPNKTIPLGVTGGCPPYIWSVSGNGFTLGNSTDSTNQLSADEMACGTAEIKVTSCDGSQVTGYVRSTGGTWNEIYHCQAADFSICAQLCNAIYNPLDITESYKGKYRYINYWCSRFGWTGPCPGCTVPDWETCPIEGGLSGWWTENCPQNHIGLTIDEWVCE